MQNLNCANLKAVTLALKAYCFVEKRLTHTTYLNTKHLDINILKSHHLFIIAKLQKQNKDLTLLRFDV